VKRGLFILIPAALAGVASGAGSFWAMTGPFGRETAFGPWSTMVDIGRARQNPYSRARVAIYGIWGLPASDALYFSARVDSQGHALDQRCSYAVIGATLPARWWSLTAYRDGFFIANPTNRYSWSKTDAYLAPDGRWTIHLNPDGSGANGLALGHAKGQILLSLRLYQPNPGIADHRDRIALPSIERLSC
jgi:hypothetical protein